MSATTLFGAIAVITRRRSETSAVSQDADEERGRVKLKDRHMFDDRLLRDIGFHEEASHFRLNRFPGF